MVRVDVPFGATVVGENAFVMVGGAKTFNVAEAVRPVPPSVELTAPVVLAFAPAVVPRTLTLIVQLLPAVAIAPPVKPMLVAPIVGAKVPPQEFDETSGLETSRPAGKVSLMAIPVSPPGLPAGLVMTMLSVDWPLSGTPVGTKTFDTVGGAKTLIVAFAVRPLPDSVELTLPVVFSLAPAVVPLTATLIEQAPLDVSEPPLKLIAVLPAVGANVPPQVFVAPGVAATSKPAGKLSVIAKPVSVNAFGLVKLIVSVDVPLTGMLVGEKLLATVGAAATVNVAEAVPPAPP